MTSNLGSEHFRRLTSPLGFGMARADLGQVEGDVIRDLERRFPPEFRNRIDEVVLFAPLTKDEVREIARLHLARIADTLKARGRSLHVDPDALERIVETGHSLAYGARFLKRVIDDLVKLPISEQWQDGHSFHVRLEGKEVAVDALGPRLVAERPERLAYGT
jgi:ATP-dependent Clp protease ATP-binding subunit ClpA